MQNKKKPQNIDVWEVITMFEILNNGINGLFLPFETMFESFFGFKMASLQGISVLLSLDVFFAIASIKLAPKK